MGGGKNGSADGPVEVSLDSNAALHVLNALTHALSGGGGKTAGKKNTVPGGKSGESVGGKSGGSVGGKSGKH